MSQFLSALFLAVACTSAFALGPIPNGTYTGTKTCTGQAPASSNLVLTDDTMEWDGQKNQFIADSNGFFKMSSVSGLKGSGIGHFTKNGLHYEAAFEIPLGNGKVVSAPGEDTFSFENDKITVVSSASMGPMGKATCSAVYSKTP